MARSSNAAAVRAMWEAWNEGGIDAFLAIAPPDVEWRPSVAGGHALWGSRDIRTFFRAMEERGESLKAEITEIEEIDDAVLVIGHLRRTTPSGSSVDPMAWLYSFRDGELWRATAHHTPEEARQAARFVGATLPPTGSRQPVLDIEVDRNDDGELVLRLRGELDLATAPDLQRTVADTVEPGTTVLVDLSGLVFMDSTGMRGILEAHRSASQEGWKLRLGRAQPPVQRVFAMSGMEKVLPFDPPAGG